MRLMHDDVEWIPLVTEGGPVHGTEALRQHLEAIAAAGSSRTPTRSTTRTSATDVC